MGESSEPMRDGDIYFWSWKDLAGRFMPYHCCAQIAIVDRGVLRDTYWGGTSDNKIITAGVADLVFKGNVDDMRTIREEEIPFYRWEDVIDMRHPNDRRAPIYVKKSTTRDAARMTEALQRQIEQERHNIEFAEKKVLNLEDALEKVAAGNLDSVP